MKNYRRLSILIFSLFSSWLLAFPFQGQVLYAISQLHKIDMQAIAFAALAAHFLGLFCCGFFVRTIKSAKALMIFSISVCIAASTLFFFSPSDLWQAALVTAAFLSGACIASWGFYFRGFTPSGHRLKTAADMMIYSNILMIALNTAAILIHPYAGLALSIMMLSGAMLLLFRLPDNVQASDKAPEEIKKAVSPRKPLAFLCLFIVIITINSGLMYQVVNPAFAHHQWLVSWYWAVPYIIALFVVRNLSGKIDRSYVLYVAIAMIGLSFTGFMILDRSALSYILIDTLMLGAFGVYDLFWWSILGEMLDFHHNPAKVFGIGLSANVLGIFIGGLLGSSIVSSPAADNPSVLALVVVFVILMILPLLHRHLSILLKNHAFLSFLYEIEPTEQNDTMNYFKSSGLLTEREIEVAALLLKGRTYKMIAAELFLSENTVKTHIKNIYSKFNIQSKTELVKLFIEKNNCISQ